MSAPATPVSMPAGWGLWQPGEHGPRVWAMDDCRLWAHRQGTMLRLGSRTLAGPAADPDPESPPPDLAWLTVMPGGPSRDLELRPALPDLPLVARCPGTLDLPAGAELRLALHLPLRVQVRPAGDGAPWLEVPLRQLRRTWAGTPRSGELCYTLDRGADPGSGAVPARPGLALCPVRLCNRGDGTLRLDRILVPALSLSLYATVERLCTDELVMHLSADGLGTQETGGTAPAEAPGALRVAEPQQTLAGGLLGRTLVGLRDLPGSWRPRG